jgi:hypothetical protein
VAAANPFFVEHAVKTVEPLSYARLRAQREERADIALTNLSAARRIELLGLHGMTSINDLVKSLSDESLDDVTVELGREATA